MTESSLRVACLASHKSHREVSMKTPEDMIPGFKHKTSHCGYIEILAYESAKKVQVRFINTGSIRTANSGCIRKGSVKDFFAKSVNGVGYLGGNKHKPREGGIKTKAYETWHSMLRRCYSEKCLKKEPSYIGCSVCEEWRNFQNFAEWFYDNYKDGLHLDKDILVDGNKIYSHDTCLFVTQKQNSTHAQAKIHKLKNPNGEIVEIYNLSDFCKENGLDRGTMYKMISGKQSHHKGWRKA